MKKYCVYVLVFPNNKKYFGMTSKDIKRRWQNGTGYEQHKQFAVYNAIQKYGWDNIDKFVLVKDLNFDQASNLEEFFITAYGTNYYTYDGKYGYNLTDGGKGTKGHKVSEKSCQLMASKKLGKTGKDCPNSRVVLCDGVEYESLKLFCEAFGLKHQKVSDWLRGEKAMPVEWYNKGLHYKNENYSIRCQIQPHSKQVYYDGIIYKSLAELSRTIHVHSSSLCKWLKDDNKMPQIYKDKGLKYI